MATGQHCSFQNSASLNDKTTAATTTKKAKGCTLALATISTEGKALIKKKTEFKTWCSRIIQYTEIKPQTLPFQPNGERAG